MDEMARSEADSLRFTDVFNARCVELGLLSAPEIAQRIVLTQPAAGKVDLARSVRNWQAGRNLPRPDFYRIIKSALGVDRDEALDAVWNRAYSECRARSVTAQPPEGSLSQTGQASEPSSAPAGPSGSPVREGLGRAWSRFIRISLETRQAATVLTSIAALVLGVVVSAGWQAASPDFGRSCDVAAGARWDPQRNLDVAPVGFADIRAAAIEACEEAVRIDPDSGRYWFQLGRAHERDAKWHGNYASAYWAFRKANELDHHAAALSLGLLYDDGHADAQSSHNHAPDRRRTDRRQAATFYERAALAGLPMGLYCHAIATLFGWSGEPPDSGGALISAQAAAAAGSRQAIGLVAELESRSIETRHIGCSLEHRPEHVAQGIDSGHRPQPPGLQIHTVARR